MDDMTLLPIEHLYTERDSITTDKPILDCNLNDPRTYNVGGSDWCVDQVSDGACYIKRVIQNGNKRNF